MEYIDSIRINLSSDKLLLLNICLAFMMFGVALDLKVKDFKNVVNFPKAYVIGLSSQLIALPILTVLFLLILRPAPSIALGLLLVSACPGGNVSNFSVHYAKGKTALSVAMTSTVTLGAVITTPLLFSLLASTLPDTIPLLKHIEVGFLDMFRIIVQLIVVPLLIGMFLNWKFPKTIAKIKKPVKQLSLLLFIGFILSALAANYDNLKLHLHLVFWIVIAHNILALLLGYSIGRISRLEESESRALSLETGIQNSGLGLILIFNFFPDLGGMTLVAAWWGIWDLISALLISHYWSRRPPGNLSVD